MVVHAFHLRTWEAKVKEFKASLSYAANLHLGKETETTKPHIQTSTETAKDGGVTTTLRSTLSECH